MGSILRNPWIISIAAFGISAGIFLSAPTHAWGYTVVSSDITSDTTWTASSSPYVITGQLTVTPGAVLSIEPGVVIELGSPRINESNPIFRLTIAGSVIAHGTAESPILFTSTGDATTGQWPYVRVVSGGTATFTHTHIRNGYGVRNDGGELALHDSVIGAPSSISTSSGGNTAVTQTTFILNNSTAASVSNAHMSLSSVNIIGEGASGISITSGGVVDSTDLSITAHLTHSPISINGGIFNHASTTITGSSRNGIVVFASSNIADTSRWTPDFVPYIIDGRAYVSAGNTLTIEPGTVIQSSNPTYDPGTWGLFVSGTLHARGVEGMPVTFTHTTDQSPFGGADTNATLPRASQSSWGGITVNAGGDAHCEHTTVRYGAVRNTGGMLTMDKSFLDSGSMLTMQQGTTTLMQSQISVTDTGVLISNGVTTLNDVHIVKASTTATQQTGVTLVGGELTTRGLVITGSFTNPFYQQGGLLNHTGTTITGSARNGIYIPNGATIPNGTHWMPDTVPYILAGDAEVPAGATATVDAGTVVKSFSPGTYTTGFRVSGALYLNGTEDEPIAFTHIADDSVGGDTDGNGLSFPGTWKGILVRPGGEVHAEYAHINRANTAFTNYGTILGDHLHIATSTIALSQPSDTTGSNGSFALMHSRLLNNTTGIDARGNAPGSYIQQSSIIPASPRGTGVRNLSVNTITATHNWWNDPTGPYDLILNPTSQGASVDGNITIDPVLTVDPFVGTHYTVSYAHGAEYADDTESPGVDLNRGTANSTPFTFKVVVSPAEPAPTRVDVVIDADSASSLTYSMHIDTETEATEGIHTYARTTQLPRGVHSYHFEVSDNVRTTRLPETGELPVEAGLYMQAFKPALILGIPDVDATSTAVGTVWKGDMVEVLPLTTDCPSDGSGECNNRDIVYQQQIDRDAKGNPIAAYVLIKVRFKDRSDNMTEKTGFMVENKMMTIIPTNQKARIQKLITEERQKSEYDALDNFKDEVLLAITSLESAGTFNNEVTSGDSPFSGIKQVHPNLSGGFNANCLDPDSGKKECSRAAGGYNWKNINSSVPITDIFQTPISDKGSVIYMGKNYISTAYNNLNQGLRDNIDDGLNVLKQKQGQFNGSVATTTIEGVEVGPRDKEIIKTLWAYNGWGTSTAETTTYLPSVADRLASLSDYFAGPFADTTHLQSALRAASTHRTEIKKFSPVYLRIYDPSGNVASESADGFHNTIPDAVYTPENESVTIFFPEEGQYRYDVVAYELGHYGLTIETQNGEASTTITLFDIPVTTVGETHEYTVNTEALANGEPGVTQKVDANGDGTFEQENLLFADGTPAVTDTTPPEARISFNTTTNTILTAGIDDMSSTTVTTTSTSSIVIDEAGNTLTLNIARILELPRLSTLIIPSFTYSPGTTTSATTSVRYFHVTNQRTGKYTLFISHIKTPTERFLSVYIALLNKTYVLESKPQDDDADLSLQQVALFLRKKVKTLSGLVIPFVTTDQGGVIISY